MKIKQERCIEMGLCMVLEQCTVRRAAELLGVSKSTIHKHITRYLPDCDQELWIAVKALLEKNKEERSARGGRERQRIKKQRKG